MVRYRYSYATRLGSQSKGIKILVVFFYLVSELVVNYLVVNFLSILRFSCWIILIFFSLGHHKVVFYIVIQYSKIFLHGYNLHSLILIIMKKNTIMTGKVKKYVDRFQKDFMFHFHIRKKLASLCFQWFKAIVIT